MSRIIDSFPEWFNRGIFTRLGTLFPEQLPWANENGQTLDQMYFGNHSGDKETSPLLDKFIEQNRGNAIPEVLTEEQITTLANILYTRYGVQWDKLYKVLSAEYNPIENYSMTEEETPDITRTETPDITRTETPDITRTETPDITHTETPDITRIETPDITHTETPDITHTETPDITREKTTSAQSDFTVTTNSDTASDVYGFNSPTSVPQAETNGNSTVTTQGDADKNVTTENETETGSRTQTETGSRTQTETGIRTQTETGTRTETETGSRTQTETGTRTETETGTRTERETGKRTLTRSGNIGVTTSQQMLESEIKLWEWNFYETVFKDVDTVLTVPKYNFYCRRFIHND